MGYTKNILAALIASLCLSAEAEIKTVTYVDPGLYVGTWYQIARNPHPFEAGCVCSRQVLSPINEREIEVYNSCNLNSPEGTLSDIRGIATNDDPVSNSKFTVDFNLPRKGQYWIVGLDAHYRWAVVSDSLGRSLYVLSKTPHLAPELYQAAVAEAATQLDVSQLQMTLQNGCQYPVVSPRSLAAPTDPNHPGSKVYSFGLSRRDLTCQGRAVNVFLPTGGSGKVPAVVYGHGQALNLENYQATLEHLAKKGVAAIFPTYDNGFFDQDWPRMGRDYVNLTHCAIQQTGEVIDRTRVVFSGHSKGAYVASIAAGLAEKESLPVRPKGVVLFQTAGFDSSSASHVAPSTSVIVVYSDQDTVVGRNFSDSYYSSVRSEKKQFFLLKSYPRGPAADHQWPLTKGGFFGGGGEGPLHYYSGWKWLVASALDLNEYLYGAQATDKGLPDLRDDMNKNF